MIDLMIDESYLDVCAYWMCVHRFFLTLSLVRAERPDEYSKALSSGSMFGDRCSLQVSMRS